MTEPTTKNLLVDLLMEAFPAFQVFPSGCWVRGAIDDDIAFYSDEIEVTSRLGKRDDLVRRLQTEHPAGGIHKQGHDDRLLTVFTEAQAFAWAVEVAGLQTPTFAPTGEGGPDLQSGDVWIEAKTVGRSEPGRAEQERVRPHLQGSGAVVARLLLKRPMEGLKGKFQATLERALRQWAKQDSSGELITFMNWSNKDPVIEKKEDVDTMVLEWASDAESQSGSTIVVCWDGQWRDPFYPGRHSQ